MTTAETQIEMAESMLGTEYLDPHEVTVIAQAARQYHRHGNNAEVLTEHQRDVVEAVYARCFQP
jgi:hypothetical protein